MVFSGLVMKNEQTYAKKLNLKQHLPPAPPRPHTQDFTHITIMIAGFKNPILKLRGDQEIRIGRQVEASKIRWNNLDLDVYDAQQNTISRRHCHIYLQNGAFFIKDLESCNGTWLNGRRLEPNKPVALSSRDYLQVGKVGFWIFLPSAEAKTAHNTN